MKKYLAGFLSGLLTVSLLTTALAISGRMTIEVDPINIQVNGETFVPTDVTGTEVPVFAYNGTTYAPLRALAEAYGLEVGYDAAANMATVSDPDVDSSQPTVLGNDELVVYDENGEVLTGCEFDTISVFIYDRKISAQDYTSIEYSNRIYLNFELLASEYNLDTEFYPDDHSGQDGAYLACGQSHYVTLRSFIEWSKIPGGPDWGNYDANNHSLTLTF